MENCVPDRCVWQKQRTVSLCGEGNLRPGNRASPIMASDMPNWRAGREKFVPKIFGLSFAIRIWNAPAGLNALTRLLIDCMRMWCGACAATFLMSQLTAHNATSAWVGRETFRY